MPSTLASRRARVAALAAAALACLQFAAPQSASAQAVTADPEVLRAYEIAKQHWGAVPCGDRVAFSWVEREQDVNGEAFWTAMTAGDPRTFFDCRVELNTRAPFDWPMLCTVVVHEVGHLLGRGHTDDPDDVMHDLYTRPLPTCSEAGGTIETRTAEPRAVLETTTPVRTTSKRKRCRRGYVRAVRRTSTGRRVVVCKKRRARA